LKAAYLILHATPGSPGRVMNHAGRGQ
jgi:hypothetical protein